MKQLYNISSQSISRSHCNVSTAIRVQCSGGGWGKGERVYLIHHHGVGLVQSVERLTTEMEVLGLNSWAWTYTQGLEVTEK